MSVPSFVKVGARYYLDIVDKRSAILHEILETDRENGWIRVRECSAEPGPDRETGRFDRDLPYWLNVAQLIAVQ